MEQPAPLAPSSKTNLQARLRRVRPLAILALFLIVGALLRNALGIEWSTDGVRSAVADAGIWAPIVFIAFFTVRLLLVIPSMILLSAGGLLFGALEGSIYGTIGLTLSGLINFGLVRWAGATNLRASVTPRLQRFLDLARSPAGVGLLVFMSAYPIGPLTFVQIAAATAGMGLVTYIVSVAAGSVLRSATFSVFGASLAESDGVLWTSIAMVCLFGLPFLFPRSRVWLRQLFGSDPIDPNSTIR